MWKRKEIKDISTSSVVDLKAELFKASEALSMNKRSLYQDEAILSGTNFKRKERHPGKAPNLKDIIGETRDTIEDDTMERNAHEASYVSLQRKTALYDKMREEVHETDDFAKSEIMVDFLRKASVQPVHRENQDVQNEAQSKAQAVDDPWVDVTDDFGRTRLVRTSAALKMERDKEDERQRRIQKDDEEEAQRLAKIESDSLQRESIQVSGTNKDEEAKLGNHYDNSKEIRTMGVGFYQFSSNTEDRSKQMSDLKDLRESTIQTRNSKVALKDAKQTAKDQRMRLILQKARQNDPTA